MFYILDLRVEERVVAEAVGPIGRRQLRLTLQVKFAASLVLPVPL
jgi:hypothetical protein